MRLAEWPKPHRRSTAREEAGGESGSRASEPREESGSRGQDADWTDGWVGSAKVTSRLPSAGRPACPAQVRPRGRLATVTGIYFLRLRSSINSCTSTSLGSDPSSAMNLTFSKQ